MTTIGTAATQIPVSKIIPMLMAINERDYLQFKKLEKTFVTQHSVEVWQDIFNFRLLPALDQQSKKWLLQAWCSEGMVSLHDVI
ncbi:hypothetical protein H6G06_01655 [Anabaena sphaerica FACHB-251]|uniref:Uncharacterized protein n=1 Tax=Anabaena sphaerica FACHB-251 TaxID=2692883 RepID=A0A926WDK8_9NOST|nr:hypothetical protein [Anabaena sphaerica]MBD2292217.1 hypothetical protein [Anabaena sphaerica FACHB-251]